MHHRVGLDAECGNKFRRGNDDVVHRVGKARPGIEVAADTLDDVGNLAHAVFLGALEDHVFLEVGEPVHLFRLVHRPHAKPYIHRGDGAGMVFLDQNGKTVGKGFLDYGRFEGLGCHVSVRGFVWRNRFRAVGGIIRSGGMMRQETKDQEFISSISSSASVRFRRRVACRNIRPRGQCGPGYRDHST